jgi:hypothetical protein
MIAVYPRYLKKSILNVKGVSLRPASGGDHSSNNSSTRTSANVDGTGELDAAVEENIGHALMSHSRTRLALQSAFVGKTANSMRVLMFYNLYEVVLSLALAFGLYFAFAGHFDGRPAVHARGESINGFRLGFSASALTLLLTWADLTSHLDISLLGSLGPDEPPDVRFIRTDLPLLAQSLLFLLSARDNYNDFSEFMWTVECRSFLRTPSAQLFSIKAVYMMIFRCSTVVIGSDPLTWYSSSNDICTLFSTFPLAMSAFDGLRTEDKVSSTSQSNTDADFLNLLHLAVPIAYAILAFLPFPVIVAVMLREMRMLCRLIMATDDQFRADAARGGGVFNPRSTYRNLSKSGENPLTPFKIVP